MSSWFSSITGYFSSKNKNYATLNSVLNVLETNQEKFTKELEEVRNLTLLNSAKDIDKLYENLKTNLKTTLDKAKEVEAAKKAETTPVTTSSQPAQPSQPVQSGGRRNTKSKKKSKSKSISKSKVSSKKSKLRKRK
jgi:hypothetical protein